MLRNIKGKLKTFFLSKKNSRIEFGSCLKISDFKNNGVCSKENCMNEKCSLAIEKRNFRERNRVKTINSAFQILQLSIPSISHRNKRTSKLKILRKAIQYIRELENLLFYEYFGPTK